MITKKQLFTYARSTSLAILTWVASSLPAWAQVHTLDRVVAVVDDDVVMASELQQRLDTISAQIASQNVAPPPVDILQRQVLEELIVERLQLQMGLRVGIAISDAELEQAIAQLQQNMGVNPKEFYARMATEGLSPGAFRQQIREELIIRQVVQGGVNSRIQITDQQINNFLRSKEGEFWKSPQYQLGHILITTGSNASVEEVAEAHKKANQIYQQASTGGDFRALAISNSSGQNALSGGDLGWRKTVELPSLFAEALKDLEVGATSKPFRSGAGFHLLKIHAQRGAAEQVVEQTKVRHILIKPSAIVSDDDAYNLLIDLRKKIVAGEMKFEEQAREHSEDIGSMLQGGDLGWSMPGKFVPEFTAAMNDTPVDEMSMPFRSEFGWHLLKVEGRRKQDMSEQFLRNQAANLLRKRRFEEELLIWRQEMRDAAYVEIKLPEPQDTAAATTTEEQ